MRWDLEMMNKIQISIVIPCFNCINTIDETLESILKQSYQFFEVVLVDDGSSDGTLEHLHSMYASNEKIKIVTQSNSGVSAARNRGVSCCDGELIAFLDSDDLFEHSKLDKQIAFLLDRKLDIVFAGVRRFEDLDSGRVYYSDSFPPDVNVESYLESVALMDLFSYVNFGTAIFRAEVLRSNSWSIDYKTGEDWELWCRIAAQNYKIGNYPEVTNFYRKHKNNTTKKYTEIMTLQSHVNIIRSLPVGHKLKRFLIRGKIQYYSNVFKNRKSIAIDECIAFIMYMMRNFSFLSVKSIKNATSALFKSLKKG